MKVSWKITVITVVLNNKTCIKDCIESISSQTFGDIEHIVIDGGSTDKTLDIAKEYGCRIINGGYKDNQEARRYIGYKNAKNEILVYIDSDNYLPDINWLRDMVLPFIEDSSIVASQTLRYGYSKKHSLMNRYFALFGFNDPVVFALGKTDRLAWFNKNWNLLGKVAENNEKYYVIEFKADALPTIGCNGFLVRKKYFDEVCKDAEQFFHTDVNYDIIKNGHNRYAIVKNDIYHVTSETFFRSMLKRIKYMNVHHNKMAENRRYKVFDSSNRKDVIKLLGGS